MKNPLFINKKVWGFFSEEEMSEYKNKVFCYYRENGFPHFTKDVVKFKNITRKISESNSHMLLDGDKIKQSMNGLNVINSYMTHMQSTNCRGFKSPMECFKDDVLLKKAIDKRISMGDNMSDAGMRKALSWTHGTHRVSNFRPTVAKYIYDHYSGNGKVIDFSCGYGGRLLGAITSPKVKLYCGSEPCQETFNGLIDIDNDLNDRVDLVVDLHNDAFEDTQLIGEFDLAFSSPPYFNTEEYAYDENQSFVRYTTKDDWRDKFLYDGVIKKCHNHIKSGGYFIINVANVKTYPYLENDVKELSIQAGFEYIKTYKMALSSLMQKGFKYEPIFVFKKP